jgi:small subunit ribosomal protein S29
MDDETNNRSTEYAEAMVEDNTAPLSERDMKRQRAAIKLQQLEEERERFRNKKGRGWSDPWDLDPFIERGADLKSLLDWAPEYVSRISQERVQIYTSKDGRTIPTLSELANEVALPLPPPPNPAQHMKAYALYRKRYIQKYIYSQVVEYAEPKVNAILKLSDWDSKQDAIDILYEQVEFALRDKEVILSKQPNFGTMVERAIEQYLRMVQKTLKEKDSGTTTTDPAPQHTPNSDNALPTTTTATPEHKKIEQKKKDELAVPIFIDCYNKDVDKPEVPVPKILIPMKCSIPTKPMLGRVVEEWELAALKTSKRIMLRQCTRTIAQIITNATTKNDNHDFSSSNASTTARLDDSATNNNSPTNPITSNDIATVTPASEKGLVSTQSNQPLSARILVHGVQGVGKTAVLASIVACARRSGAIVLFIPDGNQMHQNGFYVEPDDKRTGIFNLPILTQTVCRHLMESHENEMKDFMVEASVVDTFFTESQIRKIKEYTVGTSISLVSLLNNGIERTDLAPMCYAAAMYVLMSQNEKDFIMVLDEGNCFYIPQGHYYHESYDFNVKKSIPYHQISLFEPFLNTMNITSLQANDDNYSPTLDATSTSLLPSNIQRGAIIIGTTESHAIPRIVTDTLIANAKIVAAGASSPLMTSPLHLVEVPRLTSIEVQHMVSNYEATGVGNLRLDRGKTVMNHNEVSYLHMVSGGIPQHLMNACMME